MRAGRELDTRIAQEIFGHQVWISNDDLFEQTTLGARPLRHYSSKVEFAWEVAEKCKITLMPIEGHKWFAFSGTREGWKSPQEFISYLQTGQFAEAGAAFGDNAATVICQAALISREKQKTVLLSVVDSNRMPHH